jgi:hypothetical protein
MNVKDLLVSAWSGNIKVTFTHYATGEELVKEFTLSGLHPFGLSKQDSGSRYVALYNITDTKWDALDVTTIINWTAI